MRIERIDRERHLAVFIRGYDTIGGIATLTEH